MSKIKHREIGVRIAKFLSFSIAKRTKPGCIRFSATLVQKYLDHIVWCPIANQLATIDEFHLHLLIFPFFLVVQF